MFGEHRRDRLKQADNSKFPARLFLRPLNRTVQNVNGFLKHPCVVCECDGVKGISGSLSSASKIPEFERDGAQTEIRMPEPILQSDRSD